MKAYEVVVMTVKKEFHAASIVSASSHLTQLFRIIRWSGRGIIPDQKIDMKRGSLKSIQDRCLPK